MSAKLSEFQVAVIQRRYAAGQAAAELAQAFRVSRQTIYAAIKRSVEGVEEAGERKRALDLTAVKVCAERYAAGESFREISFDIGISATTISRAFQRYGIPVRRAGKRKGQAGWRVTPKERAAALWSGYRLVPADVVRMWRAQDGKCPICEKPIPQRYGKGLCIDHDHATKAVRGLLCPKCNQGLGFFGDDHRMMSRAVDYLLSYEASEQPDGSLRVEAREA